MAWYWRDLNDLIVGGMIGAVLAGILRLADIQVSVRRRKP